MGDLTRIDAAGAVEITDGIGTSVPVTTSVTGVEPGLVTREARTGQQDMASSIPIVVASNQPGSLKKEDDPHVVGSYGAYILGIRNDGATATLTSADGDYSPISVDSQGRIYITGSISFVPSGTQTVVGTVTSAAGAGTRTVVGTVTSVPSGTQTVTGSLTTTPSGTQTVAVSTGTQTVVGTVTSVPSGTQTVVGTVTSAAGAGTRTVVGTVTSVPSGTQTVTGSLTTAPSGTQTIAVSTGTQTVVGTVTSVPSGTQGVSGTVTSVAGAGTRTVVVSGTVTTSGSSGVAYTDKGSFVEGTGSFTPIGGVYNETISADPTEDQAATARITAKRGVHVNLRDSGGTELIGQQTMAESVPVVLASDQPGATYAEDSAHVNGDFGAFVLAVRNDGAATTLTSTDGDYSAIAVDSQGRVFVTGTISFTPSGTQTVVGTVTSVPSGTQVVSGTVTSVAGTGTQTVVGTVTSVPSGTQGISGTVTSVPSGTQTVVGSLTTAPSGTQTIAVSTGTQTVVGTVTSVPSGTQAVSGSVTSVAGSGTRTITGSVTSVPSGTQTVVVSGTVTTTGGGGGGTEYAEDTAHTSGDLGTLLLAVRNDNATTTLTSTNGDYSSIAVDSQGRIHTVPSGTQTVIGTVTSVASSGTRTVTGTVTNVPSGTQAVSGTVTSVASSGTRTVTGTVTSVASSGTRTVTGTVTSVASSGTRTVTGTVTNVPSGTQTIIGSVTTSPTGTQAVSGTVTSVASTGTRTVTGDVAHDSADSGSPVKVGAKATTTNPTAVSSGDRAQLMCDDQGRLVVLQAHVRDLVTANNITLSTTTETTLLTAGGVGVFLDIVTLTISNWSSSNVRVDIRDATGGTVRMSFCVAAAGGGAVVPFTVPLPQTSANENWTAQLDTATSDIRIFAQAVKNV